MKFQEETSRTDKLLTIETSKDIDVREQKYQNIYL